MRYSATEADADALRDQQTKIEFAVEALSEAQANVSKVVTKRSQRESTLIQSWPSFDPLSDEQLSERSQIRIEMQDLDAWLVNPPPLCRAVENLRAEIAASRPLIQTLAQSRCVTEQTIFQCFWSQRLAGLEMQPLGNRIQMLQQISSEVLGDLRLLLEARRPAELTPDEVRNGIFQRGVGRGNRALSFEEREKGVAFE